MALSLGLRTIGKYVLFTLVGIFITGVILVFLYLSGWKWWGTLIEIVEKRNVYYAGSALDDIERHREAAAALARGDFPEVEYGFFTLSQDHVVRGDGLVLLMRQEIERPLTFIVDEPDYRFITLYLPGLELPAGEVEIEWAAQGPRVVVPYAEGAKVGVDAACVGYAGAGRITISPLNDARLAVVGWLEVKPIRLFAKGLIPCETVRIEIDAVFLNGKPYGR